MSLFARRMWHLETAKAAECLFVRAEGAITVDRSYGSKSLQNPSPRPPPSP